MPVPSDDASVLWSEAWWAEFLTSPAVAGVAALVAAAISLVVSARRIRADRDLAAEQHAEARRAADRLRAQALADARAERWWGMYQWTLARLDVVDPHRADRLLCTLESQAPGPAERALVWAANDLLAMATEGAPDDDA
ncbi:hypothetical protein [Cellulomonas pakistanensis]|uniref:Uncharacterized protein n=1 Tax=Cellulomonas pakistanensis TaxID=992287 RepID=A0A919PA44_9CELL|nr:hypothetical protein [Cellulomonas pakistanensis]GIG35795.1 hypothetical protein Cpa01nite_11760 [Cellulomonas pakistanensis]